MRKKKEEEKAALDLKKQLLAKSRRNRQGALTKNKHCNAKNEGNWKRPEQLELCRKILEEKLFPTYSSHFRAFWSFFAQPTASTGSSLRRSGNCVETTEYFLHFAELNAFSSFHWNLMLLHSRSLAANSALLVQHSISSRQLAMQT